MVDTIRRDEVNAVLANQRELVAAARDIKNFVADIHNKVNKQTPEMYIRHNKRVVHSNLEQRLALCSEFSAVDHSTISSLAKNSVQSVKTLFC